MNEREIAVYATGAAVAFGLLTIAIGYIGVLSFFSYTLVEVFANAFFFMPILNIAVKGVKNVNHVDTIVMITLGFIFEVLYIIISHVTAYAFMINTLKSLVVIFVISTIAAYIKKEIKGEF